MPDFGPEADVRLRLLIEAALSQVTPAGSLINPFQCHFNCTCKYNIVVFTEEQLSFFDFCYFTNPSEASYVQEIKDEVSGWGGFVNLFLDFISELIKNLNELAHCWRLSPQPVAIVIFHSYRAQGLFRHTLSPFPSLRDSQAMTDEDVKDSEDFAAIQ